MSLPIKVVAVAERDAKARAFLMDTHGSKIEHMFETNTDLQKKEGFCFIHNRRCKLEDKSPDIFSGGYPCHPFTSARMKTGTTLRTGPVSTHPDYAELMTKLPEYLEKRKPKCFWVEEVDTILNDDPNNGIPFAKQFVTKAAKKGYAVRTIFINHATIVKCSKKRVIFAGFAAAAGKKEGADWFVLKMEDFGDESSLP